MSAQRSLYVLIFLCFAMVAALIALTTYTVSLSNRLEDQVDKVDHVADQQAVQSLTLHRACVERANPQRAVNVYLLQSALRDATVVANSATTPEIAHRFRLKENELRAKLRSLRVPPKSHPRKDNPYLVDCDAAYGHGG